MKPTRFETCSGLQKLNINLQNYVFSWFVFTNSYRLFQITNLMQDSFILQQFLCYTTILNMFRAARCSKYVEDRSVTYILLKNKRIVH